MHPQGTIEDSPSFNCYTSESSTSRSIAKVIHEDQDFEFAFVVTDEAALPVFNRNDETDAITGPLGKLFIDDPEESYSYTSSEADELENLPSGTYCVWNPKADGGSSPAMTKCKKSSSTGSGSKRWRFRYLLRRSNSDGKEPMMLLASKKQTPVHEQFYVQRRAENEVGKRKSYLPYRKDLVGLFANVNGIGKMLPF